MSKSDAIRILNEVRKVVVQYTEHSMRPQSVTHQLKMEGKKELAKRLLEIIDEE
jgi:hypothetical protein